MYASVVLQDSVKANSYAYDSLNRLTQIKYLNGSVQTYTYDPAGNRLAEAVTTPHVPLATTGIATAITALSATLNGSSNSEGTATTVNFQYGTTTNYGNTTSGQSVGSGTSNVSFITAITGLTPQTIYHYRAVANNLGGTGSGADKTFTTLAQPVFGMSPQSYLGATGVEVSLSVNPNGVATWVYFQYSTNANFSGFLQTATQSVGSGKVPINIYALFPGLLPSTSYYYRMVTTSAAGTSTSSPGTFTTLGFDTSLVAKAGDFAVGSSGPTFALLANPAVNAADDVAFNGALTLGTGVTATNNIGIWTDINSSGTRQQIAQIGTIAPEASGATFLTLSAPVYNDNGAVAFRGGLKVVAGQATLTTATGVWSTSSGALALVARQGGAAPGTNGTFAVFGSLGLTDSDGAVIFAALNSNPGAGITTANNIGIWKGNSTADLSLVLRTGVSVGGKTIAKLTFLPSESYVNGQTRSFAPATGDIACGATFTDKTAGIVEVVNGTPALVAATGTAAAGVANATFGLFGSPVINNGDHTAFAATLVGGGVTTSNYVGIWADDASGTRNLIARIGISAPGTAAFFATFSDPIYNNNEAVAFRGTLRVAAGQTTALMASGIWCNSSGSLTLVARQGGIAPGCPPGATFSAFNALALPDQGGVIFSATLNSSVAANVTTTNNQGIWAVDATGALQLIVRTGDILNVGTSAVPNNKIVTALSFLPALSYVNGQGRSFAQSNGDLVYLATFSDKSTAILNVVFP
jgi:YD repeat-containing protein